MRKVSFYLYILLKPMIYCSYFRRKVCLKTGENELLHSPADLDTNANKIADDSPLSVFLSFSRQSLRLFADVRLISALSRSLLGRTKPADFLNCRTSATSPKWRIIRDEISALAHIYERRMRHTASLYT